ncbi:GFA family protein [Planktotalea sp.]|uniref:GFA family protein n=1 Tax=Planktotalea sp. TaxID=2029877 RepID=UPI0032990E8B
MSQHMKGRCACGAVTFTVTAPKTYGACHCKMCRQWCGGVWMGVVCENIVELNGPLQEWQSSKIAKRANCQTCGSSVWHKPKHSKHFTFGQGLFDDQDGWTLSREICADDQPDHYRLADKGQKAFTAWGTLVALIFGRLPK